MINKLPRGAESLNAHRSTIREIVEGPFFQRMVPEHWRPARGGRKRLQVCAKTCGEFSLQDGQLREPQEHDKSARG